MEPAFQSALTVSPRLMYQWIVTSTPVASVIILKYISELKRAKWAWYVCVYKSMYTLVSFCCSILHARLHSSQPVCRHRNTGQLSEYPPADSGTPPPFLGYLPSDGHRIPFLLASVGVFHFTHHWLGAWSVLVSEEHYCCIKRQLALSSWVKLSLKVRSKL